MAESKVSENPFTPGAGTMPAYFAGRKEQIRMLETVLNRTKSAYKPNEGRKVMIGPLVVLTGPRGIGKTLLLKIAMKMAVEKKMQVVHLTESDFSDPGNYLSKILPDGMVEGFFKKHKFKIKAGVPEYLGAELQLYSGGMQRLLHEAISERLKKGPLLILVDEAHAIPDELLREIYQEIQKFMFMDQPLAVIMAGTPSIKRHRRNRGVTFAERTRFLEFNLLSDAETQDAFVKTFSAGGKKVEPKAVEKLAKWSDNYPYFVQMAGFGTWDCIEDIAGKATITVEDVDKGIKQARKYRDSFYASRVTELRDEGLIKAAMQVVTMFKKAKGSMDVFSFSDKLIGATKGLDESSALELERNFLDLGFLYSNELDLSPGIPSLFDYMEKRARKSSK